MPIEGWYDKQYGKQPAPFVRAAIMFRRLNILGLVDFLADTGADITAPHSTDLAALGMNFAALNHNSIVSYGGVGGGADYYQGSATLFFVKNDVFAGAWPLVVNIEVPLDKPCRGQSSNSLPALLGRDFLNLFFITADPRHNRFSLEPYSIL